MPNNEFVAFRRPINDPRTLSADCEVRPVARPLLRLEIRAELVLGLGFTRVVLTNSLE